jgi:hypothetical protein
MLKSELKQAVRSTNTNLPGDIGAMILHGFGADPKVFCNFLGCSVQ